jgi:putative sigma-54 modulation protein
MEVTVTGRHMEITEAIRAYAQEKCGRLPRFYDRVQAADVVADKHDVGFEVEIRATADHHEPFIAKAQGQDLYACIDAASDKLERQLADHKDKVRNRKHQ